MAGCASVLDGLQPLIHELAEFYHECVFMSVDDPRRVTFPYLFQTKLKELRALAGC